MLIRFEVENFLSFKGRQQLSMIADKDTEMEQTHCIEPTGVNLKLLKSAAIFGANASGKSNLLQALFFMRNFIIESTSGEKMRKKTGHEPFKLDRKTQDEPGFFEAAFILKKKKYIYGFKIDREKVIEEWLYFYPGKKKVLLFERKIVEEKNLELSASEEKKPRYTHKFGNNFKGEKKKIESLTRRDSLYLTVGAQFAHPILERVFSWFLGFLRPGIAQGTRGLTVFTLNFIEESDNQKKKVVSLLKSADLGINDVKVEKLKKEQFTDFDKFPDEVKKEVEEGKIFDIEMIHSAISDNNEVTANIDFMNESKGTVRIFELAGPLLDIIEQGGVLIVDELEDSLHFDLQKKLLAEFFKNSTEAQIIFTSHNVQLLEDRLLRRDEIWFTEKKEDGSTELFSLTDFKPKPRKDKSIKNGYLNGAYGALPVLGNILSE
ncbi:MAG: AAA family ATPase [Candidatus Aminicenantes bacterium]|nr:AAA family ATPase [Candidatus Aminicenantes bacterium]